MGIHRSTINRILHGREEPSIEFGNKLYEIIQKDAKKNVIFPHEIGVFKQMGFSL